MQNRNGCTLDISAKQRIGSSHQVQMNLLGKKTSARSFEESREMGEQNRKVRAEGDVAIGFCFRAGSLHADRLCFFATHHNLSPKERFPPGVFRTCWNKPPQTRWVETTEAYSLLLLQARRLKSVSLGKVKVVDRATPFSEALRQTPLLASSTFWWLPAFFGLWPHHPCSASEITLPSPLLSELSFCLPLVRVVGIAFRYHSDNPGYPRFKSLNLITSTKFFALQGNVHRLQGIGLGHFWRALFSLPQTIW